MTDLAARYNEIAYPTYPLPATHPDRLATMGRLMGMSPRPIEHCRVLEIGCGDGGNLVPLAVALPAATFLGFDIAEEPVGRGSEAIATLGLSNVQLRCLDVAKLPADLGEFDYIVAHGLYSWVPAPIRDALLAAIGKHLAANGVAYVSYNAMPGGQLKRMLREMMLFHLRDTTDARERIDEAKGFIDFLLRASAAPRVPDPYRMVLRQQAVITASRTDADLFHDELGEVNEAFSVSAFVNHASRHGLQFLGEADYFEMNDGVFPDDVREALATLEQHDAVLREQYLDFITCRQFRKTLLCRQGLPLDRAGVATRVAEFHISSDVTPSPAADEADGIDWKSPGKGTATTSNPVLNAALTAVHEAWPGSIPFGTLLDAVIPVAAGESRFKVAKQLADHLHRAYAAGILELHSRPRHIVREPADLPIASPLVRYHLERGNETVNLRHEETTVEDEAARRLLALADGSRDLGALASEAGIEVQAARDHLRSAGLRGLLLS